MENQTEQKKPASFGMKLFHFWGGFFGSAVLSFVIYRYFIIYAERVGCCCLEDLRGLLIPFAVPMAFNLILAIVFLLFKKRYIFLGIIAFVLVALSIIIPLIWPQVLCDLRGEATFPTVNP